MTKTEEKELSDAIRQGCAFQQAPVKALYMLADRIKYLEARLDKLERRFGPASDEDEILDWNNGEFYK